MGSCALFAVILSVLIGGLGYYRYQVNMEARYEAYAGTLLSIASDSMDREAIYRSIRTGDEDREYLRFQEELNRMKKDSEARYIYMIYYPEGPEAFSLCYAVTAYTEEELAAEEETIKHLGDLAGETDFTEEMRSAMKKSIDENAGEVRFIDNNTEVAGRFLNAVEYVKTAYQPIFLENGTLVGVLCLDISMTDIYDSLRSYLFAVAAGTVFLAIVFLVLFLTVLNRQVIRPVKKLAESADDFVGQSRYLNDPSEFHFQRVEVKTGDEMELLSDRLGHMTSEIIRYMVDMQTVAAAKERIAAELQVARQLQLGLCPCQFPAFPERDEFDIYSEIRFAGEAGGDFYNFFLIDADHLCVTAGTVSGIGIPATMMAAVTATLIKSCARLGYVPSRIFSETNNQISRDNRAELGVSAFLGILELSTGKFDFVSAGELDALYKTAGKKFEELKGKKGIRLGAMENISYSQSSLHMVQGDFLLLGTTGIKETSDLKGNIYSGEVVKERMDELTGKEVRLERMCGALLDDVDEFRGEEERGRDYTVVALRYFG